MKKIQLGAGPRERYSQQAREIAEKISANRWDEIDPKQLHRLLQGLHADRRLRMATALGPRDSFKEAGDAIDLLSAALKATEGRRSGPPFDRVGESVAAITRALAHTSQECAYLVLKASESGARRKLILERLAFKLGDTDEARLVYREGERILRLLDEKGLSRTRTHVNQQLRLTTRSACRVRR